MRPNLFNFATSELSQDAFISWLLCWADPRCRTEDADLHETGLCFLRSLFERAGHIYPREINSVVIKKQYRNIDVLAEINGKIPLLIEDKTQTKNHSGQLTRYIESVEKEYRVKEFPAIYFKTFDQCNYATIEKAGYGIYLRSDMLGVLRTGIERGVRDQVVLDFYQYLTAIEEAVQAYSTTAVVNWKRDCWIGFFLKLQSKFADGSWDYVPNKGGGFMGFWWHRQENKYLQLEENVLAFKIEVKDRANQSSQRNTWYKRLTASKGASSLTIVRPSRFGRGRWMTAATLGEDYRQTDHAGMLHFENTVQTMRKAELASVCPESVVIRGISLGD
ncbi:MAG: PD-(D/E)XK nuclease family protein, partial [Pirellulales bacterium]